MRRGSRLAPHQRVLVGCSPKGRTGTGCCRTHSERGLMMFEFRRAAFAVALVAGLALPAVAQPVPVTLVALEGQDVGDGLTLTAFGDPYVNALGQVGFVYTRSDSTTKRGIWIGSGSVWHSDQLLPDT